jgi:nitronate monooxygenase
VIGSFPTVNAREPEQLDVWLTEIAERCARAERPTAPVCPNVLMRTDPAKLDADVEVLVKHKVEMVLASVGSPEKYVRKLHDVGCFVLADVGSMRHAEKRAGIGCGRPRAAQRRVPAGRPAGPTACRSCARCARCTTARWCWRAASPTDRRCCRAQVLGCELGLMGTRFIATQEAMADPRYKTMLIDSGIDDMQLTRGISGIDANFLRPSIIACGLDPEIVSQPCPRRSRASCSARMRGRCAVPSAGSICGAPGTRCRRSNGSAPWRNWSTRSRRSTTPRVRSGARSWADEPGLGTAHARDRRAAGEVIDGPCSLRRTADCCTITGPDPETTS